MKFARTLTFAGLAGSTIAGIVLAQGCSSSSTATEEPGTDAGHSTSAATSASATTGTSASSTTKTSASTTTTLAPTPDAGAVGKPPGMMGAPTTSTTAHNFAIHNLYLGDDDEVPAFTADANAWKTLGYNIDGLVTNGKSTDVCTPFTHGQTAQQVDGTDGIDNAFGAIIVQDLGQLGVNLSQTVSQKIVAGSFTIEIDTTGLDATMASQTATALGGELFAGATYNGTTPPPLTGDYFSLSDNWPVSAALLTDGKTIKGGSKISFPAAYVTAGTWVSGTPVSLSVSLSLEGQTLALTIHSAVMSFDYSVVNGQGLAKNGIISGVLNTQEFITAVKQVVGGIMGGQDCSLVTQILVPDVNGAQDIIVGSDGSVSNTAGTPCNGISIGIGFTADEIMVPSKVAPPTDAGAAAAPCP